MKSLGETLVSIQKLINNFDGDVAFKNTKGQYIFANEHWLNFLELKKEDVVGKTADDFMTPENTRISKKTDLEVIEKKIPIEFTQSIIMNGKPVTYRAIKWLVNFTKNEPYFICFISCLVEDEDKVFALRESVNTLFKEQ